MAINFDTLPQENPYALPNPGLHKAVIEEAEMRRPKNDATKPPYLNLRYSLTDMDGKARGSMFDIISESESQVVLYKIARFARACGIPLQGQIELSDLAKIVKGKTILVDVGIDDSNPKYVKPQVDLFAHEAYYSINELEDIKPIFCAEAKEVQGNEDFMQIPEDTDNGVPFNTEGDTEAPTTPTANAEY